MFSSHLFFPKKTIAITTIITLIFNTFSSFISIGYTAPIADMLIERIHDGSSPFDGQTYIIDSPTSINAGDDSSDNNLVVRAGDVIEYKVSTNLNLSDTENYITTLVLTNATFPSIPSVCLTENTNPSVLASKKSEIINNGRTLICNHGSMKRWQAIIYTVFATADVTLNNTKMELSGTVHSDDISITTAINPEAVTITARPAVDLQTYVDSYDATPNGPGHSAIFDNAYERFICYNGSSIVEDDYDGKLNGWRGWCTSGAELWDIIIYKFRFKNARKFGWEVLSPFNAVIDSTFSYASGDNGAFWPKVVSVTKNMGNGSISMISTTSNGGTKTLNTQYQLTNISGTGWTTLADFTVRYFIPNADSEPWSIVNTSLMARAFTDTSLTTRWDPTSPTWTSNYWSNTEELQSTCPSDPGAGNSIGFISTALDNRSCNNRVDLPHSYVFGGFCAIQSVWGNGCGWSKPSVLAFASPWDIKTMHLAYGSNQASGNWSEWVTTIVCGKTTIDNSGNPLFHFTGEVGKLKDIAPWSQWRSSDELFMYFHQTGPKSLFPSTHNQIHFLSSSWMNPVRLREDLSFDLAKAPDVVIEFSTTPLSWHVAWVSDRTATCDDSVGNWYRWTGIGSVTNQIDPNTITRVRVKWLQKYSWLSNSVYFNAQIQMSTNMTQLQNFCNTNPNGAGTDCTIPTYGSTKSVDAWGTPLAWWPSAGELDYDNTTGWSHASEWSFQNSAGGAMNATFKWHLLRDLIHVIPAKIQIQKNGDKPAAKAWDMVHYIVKPQFIGSATADITVTDKIPTGMTYVPDSLEVVCEWENVCPWQNNAPLCSVLGQDIICTYPGAQAGANGSIAYSLGEIRYSATVDQWIYNADLVNTARITSDSPQINTDSLCPNGNEKACTDSHTVRIRTSWAFLITKSATKKLDSVNSVFDYTLSFANISPINLENIEFIDVFPYLWDNMGTWWRSPVTSYTGSFAWSGADMGTSGVSIIGYVEATGWLDPTTISLDPKCASNNSGTTWIDGNPVISSGNTIANTWRDYCNSSDTSVPWKSWVPEIGANILALKLSRPGILAQWAPTQSFRLIFSGLNNKEDDIYTNKFGARTSSINLPVVSNDATVKVIDGSIGDFVWNDLNFNGIQDAWEPWIPWVTIELTDPWFDGIRWTNDDRILTTITDNNGKYTFNYLGTHEGDNMVSLRVINPPEYSAQTYDLDSATGSMGTDWFDSPRIFDSPHSTLSHILGTYSGNSLSLIEDRTTADFWYHLFFDLELKKYIDGVGSTQDAQNLITSIKKWYKDGIDYVIRVTNNGVSPTYNTTTISDIIPEWTKLTETPFGTGWTCSTSSERAFSCTTTAGVAPNSDYPDVIVPVQVDVTDAILTNSATVYNPREIPVAHNITDPNNITLFNTLDPRGRNNQDVAVTVVVPVKIGNKVWYDKYPNGVQDPEELPWSNIILGLYDMSWTLLGTTLTDISGNYVFSSENKPTRQSYTSQLLIVPGKPHRIRIMPENFQTGGNLSLDNWTATNSPEYTDIENDSNVTFEGRWSQWLISNYISNGIYTEIFNAPTIITRSDMTIDIGLKRHATESGNGKNPSTPNTIITPINNTNTGNTQKAPTSVEVQKIIRPTTIPDNSIKPLEERMEHSAAEKPKKNISTPLLAEIWAEIDNSLFVLPSKLLDTGTSLDKKGIRTIKNSSVITSPQIFFEPYSSISKAPKDISSYMTYLDKKDMDAQSYIVIPTAGIITPIRNIPEGIDKKTLLGGTQIDANKYLRDGVLHYPGTGNIGQSGNMVIAWHSSYWKSDTGRYKTVFWNLPTIDVGEEVWVYTLVLENKKKVYKLFRYNVTKSYETKPTNVEVLLSEKNKSLITLFTCTPIGGVSGRWIIRGELIQE
jgi:LPXTG-site transpeptidase (sortase) family protein